MFVTRNFNKSFDPIRWEDKGCMRNPQIKFTYEDYLLLPEHDRRELIEGDFYLAPLPITRYQDILRNLSTVLWDFVRRNSLGIVYWAPYDVVLSKLNVVQPDIIYISNQRRDIITENNISGAPDLVIEILSPGTADRDRGLKQCIYARYGVQEYWIVDPIENSVEVMELGEQGYIAAGTYLSGDVSSSLLPGLHLGLDEIFATY